MLCVMASVFVFFDTDARVSKYTRANVAPKYWIAYEYCYDFDRPMTETRWKSNIDWVAKELMPYGYDMISNDGWIEAAQTIGPNGYITKYNSGWEHDFAYWNKYIREKGMNVGVYYNPLWMTAAAYDKDCPVQGTQTTVRKIAGAHSFNGKLHWVDVNKDGAEAWVKGYVRYFINLGFTFLRIDFLENYENNYGRESYATALKWISEEAGDEIFLSLVMPNSFEHATLEAQYGDMFRVSDDCFEGDWNFVSERRRGKVKENWPRYGNVFDGFIAFSDVSGPGKIMMDGDFMRLNKLQGKEEKRFLFSLMVMAGSPLAVADQFDTAKNEDLEVYCNEELLELSSKGFCAKPISRDIHDAENSSRWVGQMENGDYVVGFFNRENTNKKFSIDFHKELGIDSNKAAIVRDLWEHKDIGLKYGKFEETLSPHSCVIIKLTPSDKPKYSPGFGCSSNHD